jgi:hypothetical protein
MRSGILSILAVMDVLLGGALLWNIRARMPAAVEHPISFKLFSGNSIKTAAEIQPIKSNPADVNSLSPFEKVYSYRAPDFVANLRRVGCPEETVKDILLAEVKRRYRAQEEALRPAAADHVPWGWSSKTREAKLLERRRRAAAMAREKEAILRAALGYDVHVPIPLYAMSLSGQRFERTVDSMPEALRQSAHQIQEQYWTRVEQLRSQTKGFWEPADLEKLEQLKRDRLESLKTLDAAAP